MGDGGGGSCLVESLSARRISLVPHLPLRCVKFIIFFSSRLTRVIRLGLVVWWFGVSRSVVLRCRVYVCSRCFFPTVQQQ